MRIIFFDLDCLRPDHLGCYGYPRPTSPNIDRIAADAVRFDHYYCASSPCLPSRTALMSGRYGIRNGVISNVHAGAQFRIRTTGYGGPDPANEVLPRQLRRHGLDTISISNFADRHSAWYWMCGWSEFLTPNLKCGNETAEEVNPVALDWLAKNAGRDNYFLHINYWDVHRPYWMDPRWAERFTNSPIDQAWPDDDALARMADCDGPFTARNQFKRCPGGKSLVPLMPDKVTTRQEWEHMVTGYDAAIAYTDHHLGLVLDELERQGILDETAIIISADHGDAFGEHGIHSDHVCADECIHRIPLIVRWPGLTDGGRGYDRLLTNVDLAPTLCDLLGYETPADWDGESFAPAIRVEAGGPDRDFLVWDHGLYTVQRAVRTRRHLMVRTYHPGEYTHFEPAELYDMEADPYQTTNLADAQGDVVAACQGRLDQWVADQKAKGDVDGDPIDAIVAERTTTGQGVS